MKNLLLLISFALLSYLAYEKFLTPRATEKIQLAATPTPSPALDPSPNPTPNPPPKPVFSPSPTPESTPPEEGVALQWLRDNPEGQPSFVALQTEQKFPLLKGGRIIGETKVPAGTSGRLMCWDDLHVTAVFAGEERQIPRAETDFVDQVLTSYLAAGDQPPPTPPEPEATILATSELNKTSPSAVPDLSMEISATALAEFCAANRNAFSGLEGSPVSVKGVVQEIAIVPGSVGSEHHAKVSLKTRANLPNVRLMIRASDFLSDQGDFERVEMRINNKALELRTRDNRERSAHYYYWYYYNGFWKKRIRPKTEWVRVLYVGAPVNAVGVLSKFHINIDLVGARIKKDTLAD
jgi:hypothetical protein